MTAPSTDTRYDLARSQIINLRMPAGATVACSSGLVWITQAGHPDDYWVPAGDRVAFAPGARVVIEAAQRSRIAVTPLPRSLLFQKITDRIGGWLAAMVAGATKRWSPKPAACRQ